MTNALTVRDNIKNKIADAKGVYKKKFRWRKFKSEEGRWCYIFYYDREIRWWEWKIK